MANVHIPVLSLSYVNNKRQIRNVWLCLVLNLCRVLRVKTRELKVQYLSVKG